MHSRCSQRMVVHQLVAVAVTLGSWFGTATCQLSLAGDPPRLKRAESFLGLHLDFHASASDQNIGQNTTPEMVQAILESVQPDYIQVDCKGHAGYSSYPTQVGNQAGSFVGNPLRVWRDVTARRGVGLYIHYSGVWDSKAVQDHPDWAVIDQQGIPSKEKASVFGPYADALLIPQLIELANDYQVDGVWVDGECWATIVDYSEKARQAFAQKTGLETVPNGPSEPHWLEWTEFHREAFRQYLRHYIAEVKRSAPTFQIASNWAFSDHMPEAVCCPVDFISGDYPHSNSIQAARYSSRFMSMVNTSGDHKSAGIIESIDPIGPLTVTIRFDKRPQRVSLVPGGQLLRCDYQAGLLKVPIDRIDIHEILVLE